MVSIYIRHLFICLDIIFRINNSIDKQKARECFEYLQAEQKKHNDKPNKKLKNIVLISNIDEKEKKITEISNTIKKLYSDNEQSYKNLLKGDMINSENMSYLISSY